MSSNLSEVISIFAATIMGFTILEPVHLLWINLITDSLPALALGMEGAEPDLMRRSPRSEKDGIFAQGLGVDCFWQGMVTSLLTIAAFFIGDFLESGSLRMVDSSQGTTMAFLTLSMAEIFHSFNMRSRRHSIFTLKKQNWFLWGSMVLSLVLTAGVIYIPGMSTLFDFAEISAKEYFIAMALAISIIPIVELVKLIERKCGKK